MSKISVPRRPTMDDFQGEWSEDRETLVSQIGDLQDATAQAINGGLDSTNTTSTYGDYLLTHNTEKRIRNPLADRGIAVRGIYAMRCIGVEIGSDGRPTRKLYSLSTPQIDWEPFRDQLLITPRFDLRHTEPHAEFASNGAQTLITATNTQISFGTATVSDPTSTISIASNGAGPASTRLIFATAGKYLVTGQLVYQSSAAGYRGASNGRNGNGTLTGAVYGQIYVPAVSGDVTSLNFSYCEKVSAGDYFELFGYQTSGGSLDVRDGANAFGCRMQVSRLYNDSTPTGRVTLFFFGG